MNTDSQYGANKKVSLFCMCDLRVLAVYLNTRDTSGEMFEAYCIGK